MQKATGKVTTHHILLQTFQRRPCGDSKIWEAVRRDAFLRHPVAVVSVNSIKNLDDRLIGGVSSADLKLGGTSAGTVKHRHTASRNYDLPTDTKLEIAGKTIKVSHPLPVLAPISQIRNTVCVCLRASIMKKQTVCQVPRDAREKNLTPTFSFLLTWWT